MIYIDTSALLPYYRTEPATERVQAMLQHLREPALISVLTEVEVASALARWVRGGEITERDTKRWIEGPQIPLRTLDALHLASAASEGAELITGDRALLRAAATLGVAIVGTEQQSRRVPVAIETEVP
jgi:predicted nucleic acid-binding protein